MNLEEEIKDWLVAIDSSNKSDKQTIRLRSLLMEVKDILEIIDEEARDLENEAYKQGNEENHETAKAFMNQARSLRKIQKKIRDEKMEN